MLNVFLSIILIAAYHPLASKAHLNAKTLQGSENTY